jgi:membrane protein CcdC involved in cytochrome C biogenesis
MILGQAELQDLYTKYGSVIRPLMRVSPVIGGLVIVAWRMRETRVPVTKKSIVVPPLAMSTGFGMFFAPMMRVPWSWAVVALLAGAFLLSWPLLRSTKLEARDGHVYMQRSRAFMLILLVLLALRIGLHDYIGHLISPLQTAAVFYLLAFGMIAMWRFRMYRQYEAITAAG